jgi:protoporphyrinogen/coproporphyrinogen III oxidase
MRVAVVGGGIGGLAAARALVAAGIDAHVLEATDRVGGVLGTSTVDGFVREHAASSFLGGPPHGGVALCNELGVAVEKASPRAKRRWIYLDGKLRALPSNPFELVRSDLLTWRGKLALVREPFAKRAPQGQDESMYEFATRRLGPEAARAIIAPFVTGVFAADAHDVSLEAGFPKIAALDADGGLVRGMVKQMIRGRRSKEPKTARGMYAPVGGLGAMVTALEHALGDRIRTQMRVRAIEDGNGGVRVRVDDEGWDGVVLAVPAQSAVKLVGGLPELAAKLDAFHRSPVAIVYLGAREASVPRSRDGFGFLTALGEDLRVLGVVFESTVWSARAPEGQVLLRCIFGGGRDPAAFALTDAELIATAVRDVGHAFGAPIEQTHASVVRWPFGLPQYPVGHRDHVRAAMAAARTHRIALAGSDYRGAGVNDLTADADAVVAEVRSWS